ncbi:hypothetical protein LCGC14_2058970 [marine sediment metagenome]|uniref:Uncharacterized protein n=1 Tax=marine sediment metagenome TaxID=412755 RepID=A0A0F9ELV0_9ZZZZ
MIWIPIIKDVIGVKLSIILLISGSPVVVLWIFLIVLKYS